MDHRVQALFNLEKNKNILDADLLEFLINNEPSVESILILQMIRELKKNK